MNLGKNSIYSLVILGINIAFRILTAPLVVKNFNPEVSGLYYLILNITNYFLFFDFGISRAFIYFKIKNYSDQKSINNIFFTSIFFYLFVVLSIGLSFYFLKDHFYNDTYIRYKNLAVGLILISIVQLFFQFLNQLFSSIWESIGRMYFSKYIDAASIILFTFSLYFGIYIYHDLFYMFCFILLSNIIISFLHLYLIIRMNIFTIKVFHFSFKYINILFKGGFFIMAANFVTTLYNLIDITLIPIYLSLSVIPFYVLSLNFTKLIHSLSGALLSPMPVILANYSSDESSQKLYDKTDNFLSINLAFVIILTLFILLFNFELISLWVNIDFAKKVENIVILLTISWMFHSICITAFQFFESNNLSKVNLFTSLALCLITIFLFFLLKDFGLYGFATSRIIGAFCFLILLYSKLSVLMSKTYLSYILIRIFLFLFFTFCIIFYFHSFPNYFNIYIKMLIFLISFLFIIKYSILKNYVLLKN
jgi:O-antigen/teichoic acid export membrane protein